MSLKPIKAPMIHLPAVQPGATTKEVGWSYPSSDNAKKFKVPTTGCYVVSLIENTGTDMRKPPKAVAGFVNEREAYEHAEKMPEPWNLLSTYFSPHPNPFALKAKVEEFCEWLKESSHRIPVNAEGFDWSRLPNGHLAAVSQSAAQLIAEAFGGRVATYTHESNPKAAVDGDEKAIGRTWEYTVALVGPDNRFLVDWKNAALGSGEKFVYDNRDPEDARKIRELHGPTPKWTYPRSEEGAIMVFHAKNAKGFAPKSFDPARYEKVAEVRTDDLSVVHQLTTNRIYDGPVETLRGQVLNWFAQPEPDARLTICGGVKAYTLPDPKVFSIPNDVVETAGVLSETRQTWPDDVFLTPCGQAYTAYSQEPIPLKSIVDAKHNHEVMAAAALMPSPETEAQAEPLAL